MTIGVFMNPSLSETKKDIFVLYKELIDALNANVIGITKIDDLKLVKGVILQGGDDYKEEDLEIVKYLYNHNIPTLGICLGMQKMALTFNGTLGTIKNHLTYKKYVHNINIDPKSLLYKIIGEESTMVNSRHKDIVLNTDLKITAYSNDGVIEALEDDSKKFFLGLQWHPESMITYDEVARKIFTYFLNVCEGD